MTNAFYTATGAPVALSRGASAIIRSEFLLLQAAFDSIANATVIGGTDGGTVNAYTLAPATAITTYAAKTVALFVPTITNTGASTLNISGLGAVSIKSVSGAALAAGELVAGMVYLAEYNGTEFRLLAVTKGYVDNLAYNAALPGQAGNDYKFVTTVASVASWQYVFSDPWVAYSINMALRGSAYSQ